MVNAGIRNLYRHMHSVPCILKFYLSNDEKNLAFSFIAFVLFSRKSTHHCGYLRKRDSLSRPREKLETTGMVRAQTETIKQEDQ